MICEKQKVLLCVFDGYGEYIENLDIIDDVQNMTSEELNAEMMQAFQDYIYHVWYTKKEKKEILCKYMFVNPNEKDKLYMIWNDGTRETVFPHTYKILSNIYKYTESGEIK